MTPAEEAAFEEKIRAFVGRKAAERTEANDPVNEAMIRHWTEAMGDVNPAYTDPEWAQQSRRGGVIAPPAMMFVWNQTGFPRVAGGRPRDGQSELVELFDEHGFTGVLATNVTQEYHREVRPGDRVFVETTIESISERKATARGVGYFYDTVSTFTQQDGEVIGAQRFRVLKFVPPEADQAATGGDSALEVPTRIPAPRGHDNQWWWEACDEGRILIQRCGGCRVLRHPPRPMCDKCQSMEWDSIESTLEGEVLSYTEICHPKVPGYQYPLVCAVIRLGEGTNIVSNVVGCEPADVHIGMKVQGRVEAVDGKTMLPQFYPAGGAD